MPAAEVCTGLRMSKPAAMNYGISGWIEPQEWMKVFQRVCACIQALTRV